MLGMNMKTTILIMTMVLLISGCSPRPEVQPEIKHKQWCVNKCMRDIFSNFHNNGESWGTGSSSMNGMGQKDTFNTVKKHCELIYKDSCLKVVYGHRLMIHHGGGIGGAGALK